MNEKEYLEKIMDSLGRIGAGEYDIEIETNEAHPVLTHVAEGINNLTRELISNAREIQERTYALEQEREQLHTILDSIDIAIYVVDEKTHIIEEINSKGAKLLGYERNEIVGNKCQRFICPADDGNCPVTDQLMNIEQKETILIDKGGREIPVMKTVLKIVYGGKPCLLESAVDISEQHYAAQKAAEASRAKSLFLANMSHEIRTPLNGLLGFAEILKDKIEDQQLKGHAQSIYQSGETLLHLITDILDISRIDSGNIELQVGPCDLNAVFSDMETVFAQKAMEKGVLYQMEIDDLTPRVVMLDEKRLRQILINLISNAVKYTDNGYIKVNVTRIAHSGTGDLIDLIFAVEDTGIGIEPELESELFVPFSQSLRAEANLTGGAGLGLAVSRQLTELMNGEISLISNHDPELGRTGSTFSVRFKNVEVVDSDQSKIHGSGGSNSQVSHNVRSILLVDDLEMNRSLIRGFLDDYDIEFLEASDGKEAIDLAGKHKPDMVLMDLRMPVMDGIEAAQQLKSAPHTRDIPVVIMTAADSKSDQRLSDPELIHAVLTKPCKRLDLINILNLQNSDKDTVSQVGQVPKTLKTSGKASESTTLKEKVLEQVAGGTAEEEFSAVEIEALSDELHEKYLPMFLEISKGFVIQRIKSFAETINGLGIKHQVKPLNDWSDRVLECIRRFDMDELPRVMNEFEQIVKGIPTNKKL